MMPTFKNGERFLVNKKRPIHRYDIVTFFPEEKSEENYIKRVIGLPGDLYQIKGSKMILSPAADQLELQDDYTFYSDIPDSSIIIEISEETIKNFKDKSKIPENQYFVLGDNRRNSKDSRNLGWIDREQIEGVVTLRFYPLNKIGFVH